MEDKLEYERGERGPSTLGFALRKEASVTTTWGRENWRNRAKGAPLLSATRRDGGAERRNRAKVAVASSDDTCHLSHVQKPRRHTSAIRCFALGNVPRSIITGVDFSSERATRAVGKRLRKCELFLATAFALAPRTRRPIPHRIPRRNRYEAAAVTLYKSVARTRIVRNVP